MARKLRITDNVVAKPIGIVTEPSEIKDFLGSASSTGVAPLVVRIAATHSGIVTGNNTFYLPDKMRKGAETWTAQYPKPVLVHHNREADAVGRVLRAEYVDLAPDQVTLFKDAVIKDNLAKFKAGLFTRRAEVQFIRDVLVKSEVLKDKNYQGLGFIQLTASITDPDAIQKIKDGRYLTGSVSASTDAAVCSVCESDWIVDGRCDHTPGDIYDGIPAFLIAGNFEYEEYSWVNRPADVHSSVMELVSDGVCERIDTSNSSRKPMETSVSMSDHVQDALKVNSHAARLMLISAHDSLHYQWDYKVVSSYNNKSSDAAVPHSSHESLPPKDVYDLHEQLHREAKDQGVDGSLVLGALDTALPKELWPPMPDVSMPEDSVKEKKDTMPGTELKDETVDKKEEVPAGTAASTEDTVKSEPLTQFSDAKSEDLEAKFNELDLGAEELTDEQAELIYELMAREIPTVENMDDAKLSTEKRKKLASSTFCGPGRSFPVPDCAHVTAARRLIGRYKGPGDKSRILSCVARKAKALGCDSAEDSVSTEEPVVTDTAVKQEAECAPCKEVIAKAEAETRDAIAKKDAELKKITDQLSALREEFRYLYQDIAALEDELISAREELRRVKAMRAVDMKRLSGVEIKDVAAEVETLMKLDDKQLDDTVTSVDINKIVDKLNSGLANNNPEDTVANPSAPADSAATLSDEDQYWVKVVDQTYNHLLQTAGPKKANDYRARMIREGYIKE